MRQTFGLLPNRSCFCPSPFALTFIDPQAKIKNKNKNTMWLNSKIVTISRKLHMSQFLPIACAQLMRTYVYVCVCVLSCSRQLARSLTLDLQPVCVHLRVCVCVCLLVYYKNARMQIVVRQVANSAATFSSVNCSRAWLQLQLRLQL